MNPICDRCGAEYPPEQHAVHQQLCSWPSAHHERD